MSFENSGPSSSFKKELSNIPLSSRGDPPPREIKGSIPDGTYSKLRGRQITPINELMLTLTDYAKNPLSRKTCAEVGQLILHNNQDLFKEMFKKPATGTLLAAVGKKIREEAVAAENPNLMKMADKVDKELEKINLGDSHKNFKQSEAIQAQGHKIDEELANYNELLLKVPSNDELMKKIGKLINDNIAYFNSGSVESLIIGDDKVKKLLDHLRMMHSTLVGIPSAQKPFLAQRLVSLILTILPKIELTPDDAEKMIYENLPSGDDQNREESLKIIRNLIKERSELGYECLAGWISKGRVVIGRAGIELSAKELQGIAPFLEHVTISSIENWNNTDYNDFIDSCKQLISLTLGNAKNFTKLTTERAKKLIHLNCYSGYLSTVPEEMPNLQSLIAGSLDKLPKFMPALKSLDITYSNSSGGPVELGRIASQLTHLAIGCNTLFGEQVWNNETYNQFIQKCTQLRSLKITGNQFIHLALTQKTNSIKTLSCINCSKLTSISGNLQALEEIELRHTPINKEFLAALAPQLKVVTMRNDCYPGGNKDLWSNEDYNAFIQSCAKLKYLEIASLNITSLPPKVKQLLYFSCHSCTNLKTIPG